MRGAGRADSGGMVCKGGGKGSGGQLGWVL